MKRGILFILISCFLFLAHTLAWAEDEQPVRVCTESWPPYYAMKNEQDQPVGIAVDMAHAISAQLNRPLKFDIIPFSRCMNGVKKGEYDAIVGVTHYDEGVVIGRNYALFWVLTAYVHTDDPLERFTSLEDFNDKTWLKVDLYEYPDEINNFTGWNIMNYRDKSDSEQDDFRGFKMVDHKRADVYLEDYFWAQNALKGKAYGVRALMPPVRVDPQYTGFHIEQKRLALSWDTNLGRLLTNGEIDQIYKKWTGQTLKEFTEKFGVQNPAANVDISISLRKMGDGV
ncbi:transporter substrate-binding domain-containing protein [Terasakiella sp. SH-1]|uniref:substrate-binding periplasmic protein n=1 Tax=Terasakiella sp. SH-1 TaxID=2560057 RepID=UPI001073A134|nr:transporter substrate-binding domain-containing protein [Terasakiella sp. SH-1]